LDGNLNHFDGFVFPSICDVIRNLSGMFRILGKGSFVKYIDYPQNFHNHIGGTFYQNELNIIIDKITRLNNVKLTPETQSFNSTLNNRSLLRNL
jgi:benzoyl-CoA reductase subunit C